MQDDDDHDHAAQRADVACALNERIPAIDATGMSCDFLFELDFMARNCSSDTARARAALRSMARAAMMKACCQAEADAVVKVLQHFGLADSE